MDNTNLKTSSLTELRIKYNQLVEEHCKLKEEFSENTIIQSMNDMKIIYEHLKEKNEKLDNVITHLIDNIRSSQIMINTIIEKNKEDTLGYRRDIFNDLEIKLKFINEIFDICLKQKNEIYYLN